MVKNIIALILSLFVGLGFFNGYQWYCNELAVLDNLYVSFFSICTLVYMLNSMIVIGILVNLTKYSYKTIVIILIGLMLLKIGIIEASNKLLISQIVYIFLAYFGKFLGIMVGIIYFKQIKSTQKGLLVLMFLWIMLNIIYPMLQS